MTWEAKEIYCVRAWQSPFEPIVFMAQCCIVLRESFLLLRVSENMVSPLKPKRKFFLVPPVFIAQDGGSGF